jgi:hypothetical protein
MISLLSFVITADHYRRRKYIDEKFILEGRGSRSNPENHRPDRHIGYGCVNKSPLRADWVDAPSFLSGTFLLVLR